jgi:UTP:GlnB (protein PII) uridylyltransferase
MNETQLEIAKQLGYVRQGISNNLRSMEINYRKASQEFDNLDAYIIALRESLTMLVRCESEILSHYA